MKNTLYFVALVVGFSLLFVQCEQQTCKCQPCTCEDKICTCGCNDNGNNNDNSDDNVIDDSNTGTKDEGIDDSNTGIKDESIGEEAGHDYVDLGLPSSLKWATCNVGASIPEEYGDYFAWGEVDSKKYYDWSTYKYCVNIVTNIIKYCTNSQYGYNQFVDNKITLDLEDDAAAANWGGTWRMPSDAEWDELRNNCTWVWTTQNGVNGYKVVGKNGNSIFLPAAGLYYGSLGFRGLGGNGWYWSSLLYSNVPVCAYIMHFNPNDVGWEGMTDRCYGLSVRPVCNNL